ncbi:hypothetical protein PAXINDRAFT_17590 [Paxillus involutus ATCC 200175]|uniref:Uncharacterized protein n=1 Tax=Paxillus involutus ATCC 200175 TaxID=664439 RepID=A0A0C9SPY1_PAXIN|nr:hypothetical protein PAXINDRAFT_17590 [Paxillus involutus ATCC 200175]
MQKISQVPSSTRSVGRTRRDTVLSVGLAKEDVYLSSSSSAEHACHFRHALALEGRQVQFLSEYFHRMNTVTDHKRALSSQKQKSKYILDEELGVVEDQNLTATDDKKLNGNREEESRVKGSTARLLFVLRFSGFPALIGGRVETIFEGRKGIAKLVAIVAYYEVCDCGEGRGQRGNPIEEQGGALAEACGQPGGLVGGCAEERTSVFARYLIPAFIEP